MRCQGYFTPDPGRVTGRTRVERYRNDAPVPIALGNLSCDNNITLLHGSEFTQSRRYTRNVTYEFALIVQSMRAELLARGVLSEGLVVQCLGVRAARGRVDDSGTLVW